MPSILFATPCYGGQVFAPHFKSCMALTQDLTINGIEHDWLIRWNESLVHRARMGMTAEFLKTNHTHMMWLDADIEFTSDDVAKLWNLDVDIAVGAYRMKKEGGGLAAWKDGEMLRHLDTLEGAQSVDYAGTGFMMIKREVIEVLAELAPKFDNEHKDIPALYMTPIVNGVLESEDYHFCRIAREAGYKITLDPSIRLGHWGLKRFEA